jgi:hypothetical protein
MQLGSGLKGRRLLGTEPSLSVYVSREIDQLRLNDSDIRVLSNRRKLDLAAYSSHFTASIGSETIAISCQYFRTTSHSFPSRRN